MPSDLLPPPPQCDLTSSWPTTPTCHYTLADICSEYVNGAATHCNDNPPDDLVVCLEPPPSTQPTSVYVHLVPIVPLKLRSVRIICTANKAELFTGHLAEFHSGLTGKNVCPDEDDTKMQCYFYDLPLDDVPKATLKFFPVFNGSNTFDVYDIDVHMISGPPAAIAPARIDMQHVDAMLSTANRPLSDSAERFRQFLVAAQQPTGTAQQQQPDTTTPALHNITALLADVRLSPSPPQQHPCTPNNDGAAAPNPAATAAHQPHHDANASLLLTGLAATLQQQLSGQLHGIETRLTERLAATERRLVARLDEIARLLLRVGQPQLNDDTLPLD